MKTIILDMYGVILRESKGYFIPFVYQRFPNTDISFLRSQFTRAGFGIINSQKLFESLGFDDWRTAQKKYINKYLTLDKGVMEFLNEYKGKYRMVLLSNDVADWNYDIMEKYGLNEYFDQSIVSAYVGCVKPDRKIYELALEEIKEEPSDCIFVDNSVANLITANEFGIIPILFNRDNVEYDGIKVGSFQELSEWIKGTIN